MNILTRSLLLVVISLLSFNAQTGFKNAVAANYEENKSKDSNTKESLNIPDSQSNKKSKPAHKKISKHLENVVDYYNDVVLILEKVEKILQYEPLSILHEAVLEHTTSLEQIISKLEQYLEDMKNGNGHNEVEYSSFMAAIQEEINALRDESDKLAAKMKKLSIMEKTIEDRKEVTDLLQKIQDRNKNFRSSIDILEMHGIPLQSSPSNDDQLPVEKFDTTILTRLRKLYKKIEDFESIDKNGVSEKAVNKSDTVELEKLHKLVEHRVKNKAGILMEFVPTVKAIKKRIIKLIPETEEAHNKMAEQAIQKALSAVQLEKKMVNLIDEVKREVMKNAQNQKNHDEL